MSVWPAVNVPLDPLGAGAVLAVELSTRCGSAALFVGSERWEEDLGGAAHASDLLPAWQRLCARAGAADAPLLAVAVGLGPGSFTGLRVAVATALGLARGSGAKLLGIPSAEALFAEHLRPGERGAWITDARGERAYVSVGTAAALSQPPRAVAWAELAQELLRDEPQVERQFADESARARLAALGVQASVLEPAPPPRARFLLERALLCLARGESTDPRDLRPLYLLDFPARR